MGAPQPTALAPRDLLVLSVLSTGALHGYGMVRAVEERRSWHSTTVAFPG